MNENRSRPLSRPTTRRRSSQSAHNNEQMQHAQGRGKQTVPSTDKDGRRKQAIPPSRSAPAYQLVRGGFSLMASPTGSISGPANPQKEEEVDEETVVVDLGENHMNTQAYNTPMEKRSTIISYKDETVHGTLLRRLFGDEDGAQLYRSSEESEMLERVQSSIFGMQREFPGQKSNAEEPKLRNKYFTFFFKASTDNKLARKLFGSRDTLRKDRQRQDVSNWAIHPGSRFKILWDLWIFTFLITNLTALPVDLAFHPVDNLHWMVFNLVNDTMFMLDIVCNLITGYVDKSNGEVIMDSKRIATRYAIRKWPSFLVINVVTIGKFLKLIRVGRVIRLIRYVRRWQETFHKAAIIVKIINLTSFMLLLSHWNACIQFFIPAIQGWPKDSWISMQDLKQATDPQKYAASLFRSLSHLISIGYGVFAPQNIVDTVLLIFSMLVGATCYAFFVAYATDTIQSFDVSSKQFRDHIQRVNEYMTYRKLPLELRSRVTKYYERRFGRKMFDEALILSELSETLRTEIQNHNCRRLIQAVPFFVQADPNFVNDVIRRLNFEMYMPGDTVVRKNTKADRMFFIQEGRVELLDDQGGTLTRLSEGSYFGEIALLTHGRRTATVVAIDFCNLFSLTKEHFDAIITSYPVMKRFMETIAARRLDYFGQDPTLIGSRESLLDDVEDIRKAVKMKAERQRLVEIQDGEEEEMEEEETPAKADNMVSTAFKSFKRFFTDDKHSTTNLKQSGSNTNNSNMRNWSRAPTSLENWPRRRKRASRAKLVSQHHAL